MKIVMIGNIIIETVYMICVTALAITFQNINLLWWFLLVLLMGYSCEKKGGEW